MSERCEGPSILTVWLTTGSIDRAQGKSEQIFAIDNIA